MIKAKIFDQRWGRQCQAADRYYTVSARGTLYDSDQRPGMVQDMADYKNGCILCLFTITFEHAYCVCILIQNVIGFAFLILPITN